MTLFEPGARVRSRVAPRFAGKVTAVTEHNLGPLYRVRWDTPALAYVEMGSLFDLQAEDELELESDNPDELQGPA